MENKKSGTNAPNFFCEPHKLTGRTAENILVGLSGGCDSTLLLTLLDSYAREQGIKIFAAHINHNIRSDAFNNEAARDEAFCRELCKRLDIELFVLSADLPKMAAERGESLETVAREVRYSFFAKVMQEQDIPLLATAHNADDNLETQIFNLVRGCGIDGISGVPPMRKICKGYVIRPLLAATKQEILDYCRDNGIEYVTDSTNLIPDCTRNKIRLEIIPRLEEISPRAQLAAGRLSTSAREDSDYLSHAAADFAKANVQGASCALSALDGLHPSILRRTLSIMHEKISGSHTLEMSHTDALISLCKKRIPRSSLSLPGRVTAQIDPDRRTLIFSADDVGRADTGGTDYLVKLSPGMNLLPCTDFAIFVQTDSEEISSLPHTYDRLTSATLYSVDADRLYASSRHEGDKINDGGVNKKTKKLLCDKKVPLSWRATLPTIVTDDSEILYLPLCAICDRAKQKNANNTNKFIHISIFIKENFPGGQL